MKIHVIDQNFFVPNVIASYLIETGDEPVLIETGPDTTFPNLEKSLKGLGYSVGDIKNVFVTHIHLDHSGSAWHFAKAGATVYVHPKGAPHLVDPSKLMASAQRIYGDQMDVLWGRVEPIAEGQVRATSDRETFRIGNVEIHVIDTPGHASHHNTYVIDDVAFTGDVAGIRIQSGPVLPPTPPPDINVEAWQESIKKLRELNPQVVYPTHFNGLDGVKEHLDELEDRLLDCTDWMGKRLKEGKTEEEIVPEYEKFFRRILEKGKLSPEQVKAYDLADPFWMNVGGLVRYWKKFRLSE